VRNLKITAKEEVDGLGGAASIYLLIAIIMLTLKQKEAMITLCLLISTAVYY